MKTLHMLLTTVLALGFVAQARAQDPCQGLAAVQAECSPGTAAATPTELANIVRTGTPERLMASLEYAEMVDCHACVPLLAARMLSDDNADVREFAAWWLRGRTFAVGFLMQSLRVTLASDSDPVRRARAAEALGEFMEPMGLGPLSTAAASDVDASVRAAAVSALGRLNHPGGLPVLAAAMADSDAAVRYAALRSAFRVNFFRQQDPVIAALGDLDVRVRREAALLAGQLRAVAAVPALAAMVRGDAEAAVRQSAAWALGRMGTAEARMALAEVRARETVSGVRDAIEVALRSR